MHVVLEPLDFLARLAALVLAPGARQSTRRGNGVSHTEQGAPCGGLVKVIASIEDPDVIEKVLRHLGLGESAAGEAWPRGPPQSLGLFD